MARIATYARPPTVAEALKLLESEKALVIGGGTSLTRHAASAALDVVDLQQVGLGGITFDKDMARAGAMVTLDEMARHEGLPQAVRQAARRELPSTLRAQATLGGLVASGGAESELLAVLLVHDALVSYVTDQGRTGLPLPAYLASLGKVSRHIVTAVTFAVSGRSAVARTGRTPADRPIVAAAARVGPDGRSRLALCGVGATPLLTANQHDLHPPGDFRGSSEYRKALAEILSARVLEEVS